MNEIRAYCVISHMKKKKEKGEREEKINAHRVVALRHRALTVILISYAPRIFPLFSAKRHANADNYSHAYVEFDMPRSRALYRIRISRYSREYFSENRDESRLGYAQYLLLSIISSF